MMDQTDQRLLAELENGLPLVSHPYTEIGNRLGISEDEVIQRITILKENQIIRRLRVRINQRSVGIIANALVAWNISEKEADAAGSLLSEFPEVTHCYQRSQVPGRWEYSIYTVHHGWSHDQVLREISMIAEKTGYAEYVVLFSTDEYKRTPHTRVYDLGPES
ncbi:MAG: AsnC family transcriptional regulator [Methanospirillum sp.]|uniref:siroheme decarboxylase subunit beta n=1 Tax=Methanospirillum sp. TaxID=45200 RepID=UPI00236A12E6|nr:AsnC family transcriptional regulator [Methanospirillum sp.]MDD1728873.1 AsnC family transcriptional regulator [Methanospirillum sp.]